MALPRRAALLAPFALPGLARAQGGFPGNFPDRPIRWVVGYPPGGGSDLVARVMAQAVQPMLGQPVVVDNRPGGATAVAAEYVAKSPPDGHVIMSVEMGTLVYNRALFRRLPYDPERDFRLVHLFTRFDFLLCVHPSVPVTTLPEFIAYAKAQRDGVTYCSPSVGNPHHIGMERLARALGIKVTHVPYRGAAPALQDFISGTIPVMLLDTGTGYPYLFPVKGLRPIAAAARERPPAFPDVPTFAELGVAGVETFAWFGAILPSSVPDALAARWTGLLSTAARSEEVRNRIAAIGGTVLDGGPERYREVVEREAAAGLPLVRELGLSLDT